VEVDVQAEPLLVLSFQVTCCLNDLEAFRESEFTSLVKSSIEVFSKETCTIVACHNAIRIEHGH
jgi:hypothetical protein